MTSQVMTTESIIAQRNVQQAKRQTQVGLLNLESFELSQRIANMLSNSTLVPEQYRKFITVKGQIQQNGSIRYKDDYGNLLYREEENPNAIANCVIALNMASRLNTDALMVMQNLYLIDGRPAWSSQFIIGTINSCGRFSALRFQIEDLGEKEVTYTTKEWVYDTQAGKKLPQDVERTITIQNFSCIAFAIERETGERIESSKITMEMAIKEGWYQKNGSKWKTMPEQMLRYRAASFFGRAYAPELLMGLRSAEEEQDNIIDVTPAEAEPMSKQDEVQQSTTVEQLRTNNEEQPHENKDVTQVKKPRSRRTNVEVETPPANDETIEQANIHNPNIYELIENAQSIEELERVSQHIATAEREKLLKHEVMLQLKQLYANRRTKLQNLDIFEAPQTPQVSSLSKHDMQNLFNLIESQDKYSSLTSVYKEYVRPRMIDMNEDQRNEIVICYEAKVDSFK